MRSKDLNSINAEDITSYHFFQDKKNELKRYVNLMEKVFKGIENWPPGAAERLATRIVYLHNYAIEKNLDHVEKVLQERRRFFGGK